jgi:hypothetical protein
MFELWPPFEVEIQRKNYLSYKSKVPLLIDRFERHSQSRCPRRPALHLSCLSCGRALEGEIQPKKGTELQEQTALAY